MNKSEQAQLCMLLAKLRYDLAMDIAESQNVKLNEKNAELIEAINKILSYTRVESR